MMDIFEEIRRAIQKDTMKYSTDDELVEIIDEGKSHITVFDNVDGTSREYTITNPDSITKEWIYDRIIITDSTKQLDLHINKEKLSEFVATLDKNMLLTLDRIIVMNDAEKDYDYLSNFDKRFTEMLEVNNLPCDEQVGLMWFNYQMVFINLGVIIQTIDEMIDSGYLFDCEKNGEINQAIAMTLVHEIRHLAQANPYLSEEKLNQTCPDEEDAENYAHKVCNTGIPWLI